MLFHKGEKMSIKNFDRSTALVLSETHLNLREGSCRAVGHRVNLSSPTPVAVATRRLNSIIGFVIFSWRSFSSDDRFWHWGSLFWLWLLLCSGLFLLFQLLFFLSFPCLPTSTRKRKFKTDILQVSKLIKNYLATIFNYSYVPCTKRATDLTELQTYSKSALTLWCTINFISIKESSYF